MTPSWEAEASKVPAWFISRGKKTLLKQAGFLQCWELLQVWEKQATVAPSQTRTFQPPCQCFQANRNIHTQVTLALQRAGFTHSWSAPYMGLTDERSYYDPRPSPPCRTQSPQLLRAFSTSPQCSVRNRGLESWQMGREEWVGTHRAPMEGTNGFQEKQPQ